MSSKANIPSLEQRRAAQEAEKKRREEERAAQAKQTRATAGTTAKSQPQAGVVHRAGAAVAQAIQTSKTSIKWRQSPPVLPADGSGSGYTRVPIGVTTYVGGRHRKSTPNILQNSRPWIGLQKSAGNPVPQQDDAIHRSLDRAGLGAIGKPVVVQNDPLLALEQTQRKEAYRAWYQRQFALSGYVNIEQLEQDETFCQRRAEAFPEFARRIEAKKADIPWLELGSASPYYPLEDEANWARWLSPEAQAIWDHVPRRYPGSSLVEQQKSQIRSARGSGDLSAPTKQQLAKNRAQIGQEQKRQEEMALGKTDPSLPAPEEENDRQKRAKEREQEQERWAASLKSQLLDAQIQAAGAGDGSVQTRQERLYEALKGVKGQLKDAQTWSQGQGDLSAEAAWQTRKSALQNQQQAAQAEAAGVDGSIPDDFDRPRMLDAHAQEQIEQREQREAPARDAQMQADAGGDLSAQAAHEALIRQLTDQQQDQERIAAGNAVADDLRRPRVPSSEMEREILSQEEKRQQQYLAQFETPWERFAREREDPNFEALVRENPGKAYWERLTLNGKWVGADNVAIDGLTLGSRSAGSTLGLHVDPRSAYEEQTLKGRLAIDLDRLTTDENYGTVRGLDVIPSTFLKGQATVVTSITRGTLNTVKHLSNLLCFSEVAAHDIGSSLAQLPLDPDDRTDPKRSWGQQTNDELNRMIDAMSEWTPEGFQGVGDFLTGATELAEITLLYGLLGVITGGATAAKPVSTVIAGVDSFVQNYMESYERGDSVQERFLNGMGGAIIDMMISMMLPPILDEALPSVLGKPSGSMGRAFRKGLDVVIPELLIEGIKQER